MKTTNQTGRDGGSLGRREFLHTTAKAAATAAALADFPMVSRGRVIGANDRIGVGFIGVGGRGSSHVATVQRLVKGARISRSSRSAMPFATASKRQQNPPAPSLT